MSVAASYLPRERLRGVLIGALPPDRPRYEPPIVTTLRHYYRRGASLSLLHRLSGGAANFRVVNLCWDIDGGTVGAAIALLEQLGAPAPSVIGDEALGAALSTDERRILFLQIVADYARQRRPVPAASQIATFLGVSPYTVDQDIDWLRAEGRVTTRSPGGRGGARVVQLAVPA